MKCWDCGKEVAEGIIRCDNCVDAWAPPPSKPIMGKWSRRADLERQTHAADILQPQDKYGRINKDFVKMYGTKTIEKEFKVKRSDIFKEVERSRIL